MKPVGAVVALVPLFGAGFAAGDCAGGDDNVTRTTTTTRTGRTHTFTVTLAGTTQTHTVPPGATTEILVGEADTTVSIPLIP